MFEEKNIVVDTSFISKVKIENFCPCITTLSDLRRIDTLIETNVENMDMGVRCTLDIIDARFTSTRNYYLKSSPGIIFQSESDQNETISKIELTKDFNGKLPNGIPINMKQLTLRDVIKMYPNLEFSTRGCSDYWKYSNDTISFYVKIDTTRQRYPLDTTYYSRKPIEGIDIIMWCYKLFTPVIDGNLNYEKPTYAPILDTHLNCYAISKNNELIKLGRWIQYNPEHKIIVDENYDSTGKLIKKKRKKII